MRRARPTVKAALEAPGVRRFVENKLARAENVRTALFLVRARRRRSGSVHATDATMDKGEKVAGTFPSTRIRPSFIRSR